MKPRVVERFNLYLQILKISIAHELTYKTTLIVWRFRNIIQILLIFFVWDVVYSNSVNTVFGYNREKMLAYVFGLIFVRALVLTTRVGQVANEISQGDLNNFLVKPVSYFKYWLTRDFSSKLLNIFFAAIEAAVLFLFLKPVFFIQTNLLIVFAFVATILIAVVIYFLLVSIVSLIPFWYPEAAWGGQFLLTAVLVEFLSGGVFPLDILPKGVLTIISYTPFPYLIFYPLQVYLGNVSGLEIIKNMSISIVWLLILIYLLKTIWLKGLKIYDAYGR